MIYADIRNVQPICVNPSILAGPRSFLIYTTPERLQQGKVEGMALSNRTAIFCKPLLPPRSRPQNRISMGDPGMHGIPTGKKEKDGGAQCFYPHFFRLSGDPE